MRHQTSLEQNTPPLACHKGTHWHEASLNFFWKLHKMKTSGSSKVDLKLKGYSTRQAMQQPSSCSLKGLPLILFQDVQWTHIPLLYVKLGYVVPGLLKDSQRCFQPSSADGSCLNLQWWHHFMALLENWIWPRPSKESFSASAGSSDLQPIRRCFFAPGWVVGGELDLIVCCVHVYLSFSALSGAAARGTDSWQTHGQCSCKPWTC